MKAIGCDPYNRRVEEDDGVGTLTTCVNQSTATGPKLIVPICGGGYYDETLHSADARRLCRGGKGALIQEDQFGTLATGNDQLLFEPNECDDRILYLVRKVTPTECASLQGFPKDWCALVDHKDTPEYKMWGNGMALPCVLYVMEGIAEVLQRRELERLFGE